MRQSFEFHKQLGEVDISAIRVNERCWSKTQFNLPNNGRTCGKGVGLASDSDISAAKSNNPLSIEEAMMCLSSKAPGSESDNICFRAIFESEHMTVVLKEIAASIKKKSFR